MRDTKTALADYLAWVVQEYNYIHVLGMAKPMELANIYTDVYVLDTPKPFLYDDLAALNKQYWLYKWEKLQDKSKRLSGIDAMQQNPKLFVLGGPGAGKTTFLRYLAVQAAKESNSSQIPVFVALKQWATNSEQKLIDFIVEQFEMGGLEGAKPFVEEQLKAGNLLLLLDGLDELPSSQAFYEQITLFAKQYNQNAIVLSCRLAANKFVFEKFTYMQIADFDREQVKVFVQNWFGIETQIGTQMLAELNESVHEGIGELTRTPLLLTLLCIAYRQKRKFPSHWHTIYQQVIKFLLELWDESRQIQRSSKFQDLTLDGKEKMLAAVAYEMFEDGRYLIHREELNQKIRFYFHSMFDKKLEEREVDHIIDDIEAKHGIWVQQTQNIFSFVHLTLQEYLAAHYIVRNQRADTIGKLMSHLGDDQWREVFLLVAGMLGDASQFCQAYLQTVTKPVAQDDTLRRLLHWAAERSASGRDGLKLPARRLFIMYLALDLVRTLFLDLALAWAYYCAHNDFLNYDDNTNSSRILIHENAFYLDHARMLDSTCTLHLDCAFDRARALDHACNFAFDYGFIHLLARPRALAQAQVLLLDMAVIDDLLLLEQWPQRLPDLLVYLRECSQQLGLADLHTRLQSLQLPGEDESVEKWRRCSAQLEQIILAHWGLKQPWELSWEQDELLEKYLENNFLLLECLDVATVPDRAAIENQMLLVE